MTEDQKKYLKAAIVTAVSMAGVGAFVRNWKAKKDRKKFLDLENGKNTIVVPIVKEDFMRGIPTPDERADEMDGKLVDGGSDKSKEEGAFGKVFNFFRKNASEENKEERTETKSDDAGTPVNEKKVTEEKIDGRIVLRGQDGKFVSQTDPVAVMDIEKTAQMGIVDSILNPGDFAKNVARSFKDHPLWITGGAVGSIILATKIVDYLAKERRRKSEKRLEDARESYVNLLENGEGSEKKAQTDIPGVAGAVLGTAFFVPMALTAMVANKIIENRDAERKRKKSMSNSYPQDPTFLYNVVDGEKIAMSADRALALMMFKTAMFSMCEDNEIEKSAQSRWGSTLGAVVKSNPILYGAARASGYLPGVGIKDDEAHRRILDILSDEKNSSRLLDVIRRSANGDRSGASAAISNLVFDNDPELAGRLLASGYGEGPKMRGIENAIYSSPELSKIVAKRLTDEDYKDTYGSFADEMIGKKLGLRPGSFLHKIVLWLMNAFGMRNGSIKEEFERARKDRLASLAQEIKKDNARPEEREDGDVQQLNEQNMKNDIENYVQGEIWINPYGNTSQDGSAKPTDAVKNNGQPANPTPVTPAPAGAPAEAPENKKNDGLRIPQEGDVLWDKFKNLPEIDGEQYTGMPYQKELVNIRNMGMNQLADNIDYRAGRLVGKPPHGPTRQKGNVAPQVNSNLIDSQLEAMRNSARPRLPPANKVPGMPPIGQKQQPKSAVLTR